MVTIDHSLPLLACEQGVLHVYYNALIAVLVVFLFVAWLVFAADELRDHRAHPTQRNVLGVEQVICRTLVIHGHVTTLRLRLRHMAPQVPVSNVVWNRWQSVSDVWVEWDPSLLGLWNKVNQAFPVHVAVLVCGQEVLFVFSH